MRLDRPCFGALAVAIIIAVSALDAAAGNPKDASASGSSGRVLTGKERLGDKASDEQRVNDCGVPPEKRGPRPRPGCRDDADAERRR